MIGAQSDSIGTDARSSEPMAGDESEGLSVGNDTYGIIRIPTTVAGHRVVRRAGLVIDTGIVYPGSGCEDA